MCLSVLLAGGPIVASLPRRARAVCPAPERCEPELFLQPGLKAPKRDNL